MIMSGAEANGDTHILRTDSVGSLTPASVGAAPTSYNLTLTLASTEYQQVLPANCKGFEFQCRTAADIVFAFATGHVAGPAAPYHTLKAGDYFVSPPLSQQAAPSTVYFASLVAGVIVEIIAWV